LFAELSFFLLPRSESCSAIWDCREEDELGDETCLWDTESQIMLFLLGHGRQQEQRQGRQQEQRQGLQQEQGQQEQEQCTDLGGVLEECGDSADEEDEEGNKEESDLVTADQWMALAAAEGARDEPASRTLSVPEAEDNDKDDSGDGLEDCGDSGDE
jgi:hypothetical protein